MICVRVIERDEHPTRIVYATTKANPDRYYTLAIDGGELAVAQGILFLEQEISNIETPRPLEVPRFGRRL